MAVAPHPASDVARYELARHLHAGLRDLARLTETADRCSPDALWDVTIGLEPGDARRIVLCAATLASKQRNPTGGLR